MIVCAIALVAARSWAATINVGPGQAYTTIQAGINAANNGDTVLVAPGTYYENIDFKGKAITVTSSGGAASTIIDGSKGAGLATVLMGSGTTKDSVISNFTIRNGGTSPPYNDTNPGGGIYVAGGAATIQNNIVTANSCSDIQIAFGAAIIQGNEISSAGNNNPDYCPYPGSGIAIQGEAAIGGLSNTQIIGNTIENNLNAGFGGALALEGSNMIVLNNIIRNNTGAEGAVVSFGDGVVAFVQNLVYGNTAANTSQVPQGAGGLSFFLPSNPFPSVAPGIFANNVFFNNTTKGPYAASQVYFDGNLSGYLFQNNIVYGSGSLPALLCSPNYAAGSAPLRVTNNDVYNPSGPAFSGICGGTTGNNGNISVDPLFSNASAGDFHIPAGSALIDTGSNSVIPFLSSLGLALSTDFANNTRLQNTTGTPCAVIDMGAYEYPGLVNTCTTNESLQSSLNPSPYGQSVTFTAQISSPNGVPTGDVQFVDGTTVLATQTISGTGSSTYTTSALTVGSHAIAANYQPTGVFSAASATLTQVVNGTPTTTTLICSPNPISAFGTASFAAGAYAGGISVQGGFTFTDNGAPLAQFAGPTAAVAYTDTALAVGTHQIAVNFVPTGNYAGSSASCTEVVNALPTTSTLTVTPLNTTYGSSVTLTANVAPVTPITGHVPTGTVSFYYQAANQGLTALLGTAPLNMAGVAALSLTTLQGGAGTVTCTYSGDSAFAPSNCAGVTDTISPVASTLTLTSSLNPAPALTPVTFTVHLTANGQPAPLSSSVTLTLNGQAVVLPSGNTTYTTSSLPVGSDPVTASFAGTASLLASSAALTEVINLIPTTTTLTAAPNPAYQGQTVTLTATVAGVPTPTGTVAFLDGTSLLGNATLAANGQATLTVSTLAVGTHPLTATYAAGAVYTGSSSAVLQEVILPSSFTLALSPTSVTMRGGQTATAAIQLASVGNFAGPVALSVGALPMYATATISPASVTLAAAGTGASTLTIKTLQHAENIAPPRPGTGPGSHDGHWPAVLAATLLWLPLRRKRGARLRVVVGLLWVGALVQGLTGCTNAWYSDLVVAPGSYPVTVTGTDTNGNQQSATLTVVITP